MALLPARVVHRAIAIATKRRSGILGAHESDATIATAGPADAGEAAMAT
jgi:hypothetical protein